MSVRFVRLFAGSVSLLALSATSSLAQDIQLDGVIVTSTKTEEGAIDALSGSSALGKEQLDEQFQPTEVSSFLNTIPGVSTSQTGSDTAQSINIRGLQDFGRVNVLVEGARQNFQRSGHNANGAFYLEPEMLGSVDVTRGPTSMIYGSGAIGGVVAFNLLNADDILKPGEYAAVRSRSSYGTNGDGRLQSGTAAVKVGNFDILGQSNYRESNDYEDGGGNVIEDTGDRTKSNMVNARWRPAPGHQITGTVIDLTSDFVERPATVPATLRNTTVENSQYTLGYTYSRPDTPLLDFSARIYRNDTRLDQSNVTNPLAFRNFDLKTEGFDINNTSRFGTGAFKVALTYGVDGVYDTVDTFDTAGYGSALTPGGKRSLEGAFVQSKLTMYEIVDLITAVRYDRYSLDSDVVSSDGDRVSPKVTLGVTPVTGVTLFGTYAEGYRAPSTTETLIDGAHPFPAFNLLPNPFLEPETAHNWEAGVNLKFNNVLKPNDAFRGKITAFRNKVDNYIDAVYTDNAHNNDPNDPTGCQNPPGFPVCYFDDTFRYENIASALLEGVELEATYDARSWFAIVTAQHINGKNEETGEDLLTVIPDRITGTLGFRFLDNRLVAGTRVSLVESHEGGEGESGSVYPASNSYALVDLFAQYEINENATLNLNIDNLFDKEYLQYLNQENSPGLNARIGLTMRLGAQ
jgi:hemoglobin/transferrin/lactoferrin receptor protein